MENLHIQIEISPELYSKDPNSTDLGRRIINKSIYLINVLGFEAFNFKKLGLEIESPESSIYRYFESKHTLLLYLTSWYWTWMDYQLVLVTSNIESATERLQRSVKILTQPTSRDQSVSFVNEVLLSEIVFSESNKSYQTKNVDEENKKGNFKAYKHVVSRVSNIILELKPNFPYPHMLVSTIIEGAHHQKYFAEHLPSLTDVDGKENSITNFYLELINHFIK